MGVNVLESSAGKVPLYFKLSEDISEKIDSGIWKRGDRIPSEREMVSLYGLSRITVRNAIEECVRRGKIEKIQGKGAFVTNRSIVQNLGNLYSFTQEMTKQGKVTSTKLLSRMIIAANTKLADRLQISPESPVIVIERLRCAEGDMPIFIERTFFPLKEFEFVLDIDLERKSMYKTLEQEYGICINRAVEVFEACELNPLECSQLECRKNQFGLLIKRTSYMNDKIVCYSTIISKGDLFKFTVELKL